MSSQPPASPAPPVLVRVAERAPEPTQAHSAIISATPPPSLSVSSSIPKLSPASTHADSLVRTSTPPADLLVRTSTPPATPVPVLQFTPISIATPSAQSPLIAPTVDYTKRPAPHIPDSSQHYLRPAGPNNENRISGPPLKVQRIPSKAFSSVLDDKIETSSFFGEEAMALQKKKMVRGFVVDPRR